jgi:hypothetical protein
MTIGIKVLRRGDECILRNVVKSGQLHGKIKIDGPTADLLLGVASQTTSRLEQLIVTP